MIAGTLFIVLWLGILFVSVFGSFFWIWMIIDCAVNEPSQGNDKIIWILVIVVTHWIGALIYFVVRRPVRKQVFGH